MFDIQLLTVSKRKNSTAVPDFSQAETISVSLKAPTSEESPSFLLNWTAAAFPYNYLKWGNHYYWINNSTWERNELVRIDCTLDPLATYKAEILASTQYVAFSSISGGTWLPDKRIPVMANCDIAVNTTSLGQLSPYADNYILTVLGKTGCRSYIMIKYRIDQLLANVQQNNQSVINQAMSSFNTAAGDVNNLGIAVESLANVLMQKDLLGNSYENAVSCLRSCIWVPFSSSGMSGAAETIYLGNYNTGQLGNPLLRPTTSETVSVSIPWHYTDWRRAYCEDIYLYLPLVGMVNIETTQITEVADITIRAAYCYTDGCVAYEVTAGNHVIGTYGGSCAAQYPLGINQQASAGQIANTLAAGISKTVGSLTLGSIPSLATVGNAMVTAYETMDAAYNTNPTVIGGIGGGAGALLDLDIKCISVAHNTVIAPADMAATMGVPTQKPIQLSGCSGYCQCVNAHVAAPAHGDVLNAIDMFLNSGFYIE